MQTFVVTIVSRADHPHDTWTAIITGPDVTSDSIVRDIPIYSFDPHTGTDSDGNVRIDIAPLKFEIERTWNVGGCHGERVIYQPTTHGIVVVELDFDSV